MRLCSNCGVSLCVKQQVFDNMMKRVSYRRQKRWWNAYLLFYSREDVEKDQLTTALSELSIGQAIHTAESGNSEVAGLS